MDCGFLLTQRNFGPQPWSAWTNRAVCLLAARHILGDEVKTPSQSSRHHWAASSYQHWAVGPRASIPAPGRPPPQAPSHFQARPLFAFPTFLLITQTPSAQPRADSWGWCEPSERHQEGGVRGGGNVDATKKRSRWEKRAPHPSHSQLSSPLFIATLVFEWLLGALPLPKGTPSIRPLYGSSPCYRPCDLSSAPSGLVPLDRAAQIMPAPRSQPALFPRPAEMPRSPTFSGSLDLRTRCLLSQPLCPVPPLACKTPTPFKAPPAHCVSRDAPATHP